ncbi:hypothetical protein Tco_1140278 [Tanacetum coccineum]
MATLRELDDQAIQEEEEKRIADRTAARDRSWNDDDSYENIDYVDASPPDDEIVGLEVVEIVDPEVGRIDDDILLTIKDNILREKLLNINLLIAKIDSLRDNPTLSSEVVIKSTSTSPNLFLEETNTFDNSIPESETFRFNLEEISSGSPTTRSDLSLPDYKAFYVDNGHFKEKSNGSTITHVDFSQYDSFIFDLSNDQFPPADRNSFIHGSTSIFDWQYLDFLLSSTLTFCLADALDFEASRARGFVLRSLDLQILSFIMGIQYSNLID